MTSPVCYYQLLALEQNQFKETQHTEEERMALGACDWRASLGIPGPTQADTHASSALCCDFPSLLKMHLMSSQELAHPDMKVKGKWGHSCWIQCLKHLNIQKKFCTIFVLAQNGTKKRHWIVLPDSQKRGKDSVQEINIYLIINLEVPWSREPCKNKGII